MCTYLDQVGPTYYFRRVVPAELQPFILTASGKPRTEFKISLRTKDRETAKRLIRPHAEETDRIFDQARSQLGRPVPARVDDTSALDAFSRMTQSEFEQWEEHDRDNLRKMIAEDDRIEKAAVWAANLPADHPAAILLREERERGDRYQSRYRKRKRKDASSGITRETQSANVAPALLRQPLTIATAVRASEVNPEAVSLTGLFDSYAEVRNLTPAIVKEWRTGIDKFVAYIGHDDARRVTKQDVLRWRNQVRDTPKSDGEPRSPQRVNAGFLAPLRGAFKHGISEMLIEYNPAAEVPKLHVPPKLETRDRQFTQEEARIILAAALNADNGDASPQRKIARRWIPWLCAYSGARVNEITQLRAEDVQQVEGHWIIRITPDAGRVKNKKFRNVPVHEHLIALGFLEFVETKGTGRLFYDPELSKDDSERGSYKKVGERLADWVRKDLGITDPGIMPNHAWRHTFTSRAMEAGMDERAADYIKGHASVGVSRRVYTHHSYHALAKQMAKFPRYSLELGL